GSDTKNGVKELAYDKVPLKAIVSLQATWPIVVADLHKISCPVLAFRSRVDHVVEPISGKVLLDGCAGGTIEERILEDSWPVATRVLKPPSLPEPPPAVATSPEGVTGGDTDEVWLQIVAAWGKDSESPVPPWPVSEDVDGDDTRTIADEAATSRRLRRRSDP